MRPQKALKAIHSLLKRPSFTSREAHKYGVSAATLSHYIKQGAIERIGHGIYRAVEAPRPEDFRWEDLVEAVHRVKGGVVCLISALSLYDLTEEIPRQHWIAIRNDTSHRGGPQTKVVRMRNIALGKTQTQISGIAVPIFDRERTIVDTFKYLSRETAIKALRKALTQKGQAKVDVEKVRKYARALRVKIEPYLIAVTT